MPSLLVRAPHAHLHRSRLTPHCSRAACGPHLPPSPLLMTLGLATNGRRPAGPQPTSCGTPCSFVAYSMGLRARGATCSEPCLSLTSNPPPALAVALAAACSRPCSRPCSHPRSRPCSSPRSRPRSRRPRGLPFAVWLFTRRIALPLQLPRWAPPSLLEST